MQDIQLYSLGVDVDSENLECVLMRMDSHRSVKVAASRKFANDRKGFEALLAWLTAKRKVAEAQVQITLEASGVYHEPLCYFLDDHGHKLSIVLPNKAKHYMRSLGFKSKNDKIDARGLAQMGAEQQLDVWEPASPHMMELRACLRYRASKQEMITQLSNELHALNRAHHQPRYVLKELKATIKRMKNEVTKLDAEITKLVHKDSELARKIHMICDSVTGLGLISVATVVAETGGFTLFKNAKQLTSYAGYDVIENQSGKRVGKTKISKQGNSHIRRVLFMPAFNMVRHDVGNFKNVFLRILKRTGIKMIAYVAIQRKLLCLIFALWKHDKPFDPQYHMVQAQPQKMVAPI